MKRTVIFLCIVFALVTGAAHANVLIITNKYVKDTAITKADLKEIFLGKKVQWTDNTKIRFVTLKESGPHKTFLRTYINKSAQQYSNYWRKMVFTGKGKIPKSFATSAEMVKYVSATNGAIGYIGSSTKPANVNTINVR
jgi:ABC-type phosphate transport system substrate-binding protein